MNKPASNENEIHAVLRNILLAGSLAPGSKLAEVNLAAAFGVSRERIRKVLQRLGAERLVDLIHNRGAFVARPDSSSADEIRGARQVLESGLVMRLAETIDRAALYDLDAHLRREQTAQRDRQQAALTGLAAQFHLRLAASTRNPHIERQLSDLVARTTMLVSTVRGVHAGCAHREHVPIVRALHERDGAAAARLMITHLAYISTPPAPQRALDVTMLVREQWSNPVPRKQATPVDS